MEVCNTDEQNGSKFDFQPSRSTFVSLTLTKNDMLAMGAVVKDGRRGFFHRKKDGEKWKRSIDKTLGHWDSFVNSHN